MKIVVIGGTGLIGSQVVTLLSAQGHELVAASPSSGVDTVTGAGVAEVVAGAQVVVDVSNSPSFEDEPVLAFFRASTGNLLAAEAEAGVGHHVALSVVGTSRLQASGYFRAKLVQEQLIEASGIPYSIVHATQFFEFVATIAAGSERGDTLHVSPGPIQPVAASEVAAAVADVAVGAPLHGIVEVAGPDRLPLDQLVRTYLQAQGDEREVVTDPDVGYFGAELHDDTLVPADGARIGTARFADWLAR